MAVRTIPVAPTTANYTQRVELDGADYVLTVRWNQREARWYLDLADADGEPIASGLKVVTGWALNRLVTDERRPAGLIVPVDTTGDGADAGWGELGRRVVLSYVDGADAEDVLGG